MNRQVHFVVVFDTETKQFWVEDDALTLNLVLFPEGRVWNPALEIWEDDDEALELFKSTRELLDNKIRFSRV